MTVEFLAHNLRALRDARPLVHNITNLVVMEFTADALLALGARPVMAHAPEEVLEMVSISDALVLNIGTLTRELVASMEAALKAAKERRIPACLDPVGAGATRLRTEAARGLIACGPPEIIRGNASEISALCGSAAETRGVDSTRSAEDAAAYGELLAGRIERTVVISGGVDFVFSPRRRVRVLNGREIMSKVAGMGCVASAICGACLAIAGDAFEAAVTAMAIMGVCGESADDRGAGPGSFRTAFIDALASLEPGALVERSRIDGA